VIRPVCAVSDAVGCIYRAVYEICRTSWLARPVWAWADAGPAHLACAQNTRGYSHPAPAGLLTNRVPLVPADRWLLPLFCRATSFACLEPPRRWEPWPTEPLVDRVDIHWPSDDWPAAEPVIVIEDSVPDPPVMVWEQTGGLLDMWA